LDGQKFETDTELQTASLREDRKPGMATKQIRSGAKEIK